MIKVVYCVTKKRECSAEEFFHYWKNIHGPIGARIPGLRRLVQSHRVSIPGDKYSPPYDGVAELWFDTIEALLAARQSPEWKASSDDEENFIDRSKVAYFVTQEHVIVDRIKKEREAKPLSGSAPMEDVSS
ncbi:MAG: EthD domain-containing protein [Candidatus Sulfotelmatobacter sp.]